MSHVYVLLANKIHFESDRNTAMDIMFPAKHFLAYGTQKESIFS
jgi:hypothetical protein